MAKRKPTTSRRAKRRLRPTNRAYGRRLCTLRDKLNLTDAELAQGLGVQVATLRRWQAGNYPLGYKIFGIIRFCDRYNISLDWLFGGDAPMLMEAQS